MSGAPRPDGAAARRPVGLPRGAVAGPVSRAERSLAPDLARGAALLAIALANGPTHLWGAATGPGRRPVDGAPADRAVDLLVSLLVDDRAYPLFALLFGYGVVRTVARQRRAGATPEATRALLLRRMAWLAAFGAVHALLLYSGDILLPYGLLGMVLVALVLGPGAPAARLASVAVVALLPYAVLSALDARPGPAAPAAADVLAAAGERLDRLAGTLLYLPLLAALLVPMALGAVLASRGVLERPGEHRALLRRLAVAGTAVSLAGGLPFALVVAGRWDVGGVAAGWLASLHGLSGLAGGVGYAAAAGLVAARLGSRRPGAVGRSLAATGERSLSAYLAQSVLFVPLLAPWALGLGDDVGTAATAGLSLLVWLLTVLLAAAASAAGRRGPAEALLRRLVYGPRPVVQPIERQGSARSEAT